MTNADPHLEAQFRELEESHLRPENRASPEAMGAILAEDFSEFGSSGRVWDRAANLVGDDEPFEWSIESFGVRLLAPGVALTTYRLSAWTKTAPEPRASLRSSVWIERGGRWVLLFHQGTKAAG